MIAMIELGGNITLDGFKESEPSTLVIVKKIVGNYAKNIYTNINNFENLSVFLRESENLKEVETKLLIKDIAYSATATDTNLFFALDKSLSQLLQKVKA